MYVGNLTKSSQTIPFAHPNYQSSQTSQLISYLIKIYVCVGELLSLETEKVRQMSQLIRYF